MHDVWALQWLWNRPILYISTTSSAYVLKHKLYLAWVHRTNHYICRILREFGLSFSTALGQHKGADRSNLRGQNIDIITAKQFVI